MSIKFRTRIFRKPKHWSEKRYTEFLKENKCFRNRGELFSNVSEQVNQGEKHGE